MREGDSEGCVAEHDQPQQTVVSVDGEKCHPKTNKPREVKDGVCFGSEGKLDWASMCRCGEDCRCNGLEDDEVKEDAEVLANHETPQNPWVRYSKIGAFSGLWLVFTIILILKSENPTPAHHFSVPEGTIKNFWMTDDSDAIKVSLEVTGPFLPQHYKNMSDKFLYVWMQRIEPQNGSSTNKFYKNITGVWEVPIVSNELLDAVPEVTNKKLFRFETLQEESDLRIQMVTNLNTSIPIALKVNADRFDSYFGVILAAIVLLGLYVVIIIEIVPRTLAAVCGSTMSVALLAAMNERPTMAELVSWIDMETLLLLFSMMMMMGVLSETGIFDYLAALVYKIARGRPIFLALLLFSITGVLSAFLDNLTTILLLTPCVIRLCTKESMNPVPVLMATVIISNIAGSVTPVGDPPNVIIASNTHFVNGGVNFTTFFTHMGFGAFFSLVATCMYLYFKYSDLSTLKYSEARDVLQLRRHVDVWERLAASLSSYSSDEDAVRMLLLKKIKLLRKDLKESGKMSSDISGQEEEDDSDVLSKELLIKSSVALTFVIVMFFLHSRAHLNLSLGWIALLGAILLLILADTQPIDGVLGRVEWGTLLFFASLFILMEATARLGLIKWIGNQTEYVILMVNEEARLAVAILLILWVSALASAFVDNIPLTTMMVRIVEHLNVELGLPLQPLVWSLAFGACLGGNGTLIGASANVVCAGIAEQHGLRFTFLEFFRVGFPVMMITVMVTTVYLLICHVLLHWH